MKSIFASIALFAASAFAQSSFTINTPSNVVECQPTLISWVGGTAPYFLSILPGATPNGAAIESFPETNATSLTWTVNIASGTSIGLTLRDSNGAVAQSAPFTINPGTSSSCLNTTSVVPGPTAASTPAGTTAAATAGGASASTAGTSAAAAASSTSKSGASTNAAQFGAAGIIGAAVAALFL